MDSVWLLVLWLAFFCIYMPITKDLVKSISLGCGSALILGFVVTQFKPVDVTYFFEDSSVLIKSKELSND